jgi:hypothetical protein
MKTRELSTAWALLMLAWALLMSAAFSGCGEEGILSPPAPPEVQEPQVQLGVLRIVTFTPSFGFEAPVRLEREGYLVQLDDEDFRDIGLNDAIKLKSVAGEHSVELTGLPRGCRVKGDNPRSITVSAGDLAEVTFLVDCGLVPR